MLLLFVLQFYDVMNKHFNCKLVITKKDDQDVQNLLNVEFVIIFMLMLK